MKICKRCVDRCVCRGDCIRYMRATAADRKAARAAIAALGNKKSRLKAAEGERTDGQSDRTPPQR